MEYVHITQAAAAIGVSIPTLKRWFYAGKVAEVQKDNRGWRIFSGADIDRIKDFRDAKRKKTLQGIRQSEKSLQDRQISNLLDRELSSAN